MNAPDPKPGRRRHGSLCLRSSRYLEAIREALAEEMRRDPKVFVLGEDVGEYGGAFGVTQGLFEEFGESRVVDTPISESAIIGISIGASLRGYRPVAEMQFADFISCGFDQIVNQAATLRYRYGGRASVPIVVRAPSGGNVGGGLYHSQNPEGVVHPPARPEGGCALDPVRRQGTAQSRDPRRQSGHLFRAQVSLPPGEGPGARRRRDRADRRCGDATRGQRHHPADVRGHGRAVARSRRPAFARTVSKWK